MDEQKVCFICREVHGSERTLSFDGVGINSCGTYRPRVATIEPDYRVLVGPLFALACKLAESADSAVYAYENEEDMHNIMNELSRILSAAAVR